MGGHRLEPGEELFWSTTIDEREDVDIFTQKFRLCFLRFVIGSREDRPGLLLLTCDSQRVCQQESRCRALGAFHSTAEPFKRRFKITNNNHGSGHERLCPWCAQRRGEVIEPRDHSRRFRTYRYTRCFLEQSNLRLSQWGL